MIDGVLHFESNFFDVAKILSSMTDDELNQWEKSIGFVSMRSSLKNIYDQTSNIENFDDKELLTMYPDYFTLRDGMVEPTIEAPIDRIICNSKGIYYTTGNYNQVLKDSKISIFDPCPEKIERAIITKETNKDEGIYYSEIKKVNANLKITDCIGYYNVYRTSDGRRVCMKMTVTIQSVAISEWPYSFFVENYYVYWVVWGEKRNMWGNYKHYYTDLYVSDAKFSIYAPYKNVYQPDPNNDAFTMNYYDAIPENCTYYDIWTCSRYYWPGNEIKTKFGGALPLPNFERVNANAWTRGIWTPLHLACGAW